MPATGTRDMQRLAIPPETEYGDLRVVREVESPGKRSFLCRCACGRQVTVRLDHLRSGHTESADAAGWSTRGSGRRWSAWAAWRGI